MRTLRFVLTLITAGLAAQGQSGTGAVYGTRDPHTCNSSKEPSRGAPSAAQAKDYATCYAEHVFMNKLYLVTNMQVQVGNARTFNLATDSADGIDPTQPVYDIRGSFTQYQCDRLDGLYPAPGKNCNVSDMPHAQGKCYKDTFGDWHCFMVDRAAVADYRSTRTGVPPPPK